MSQYKVQLNEDRTDILLALPSKFKSHPSLPGSIRINGTNSENEENVSDVPGLLPPGAQNRQTISPENIGHRRQIGKAV